MSAFIPAVCFGGLLGVVIGLALPPREHPLEPEPMPTQRCERWEVCV